MTGEEGDDLSGADAIAAKAEADGPAKAEEAPKHEPAAEEKSAAPAPAEKEDKLAPQESKSAAPAEEAPSRGPEERVFASPLARRLAQEKGIPLAQVKGTGPNGRIVKADIDNYKGAPAAAAAAAASAAAPASSAGLPSAGKTAPAPAASSADFTDIPTSGMRRTIAQRLTESKAQLPHYYVSIDVEMDRVLKLREVFNNAAAQKAGKDAEKAKAAKLSVGDFITKAASIALREVPDVNSAWHGDFIRR